MDVEIHKAVSLLNLRNSTFIALKPLQLSAIRSAMEKDTVVVLPTGYGKSVIYEILPVLNFSVILVVSPLNSRTN